MLHLVSGNTDLNIPVKCNPRGDYKASKRRGQIGDLLANSILRGSEHRLELHERRDK